MLYAILVVIHILVSIVLVISVLLQSSKGGGLAGTFGGSGMSGGVFGGRGAAPFLIKVTAVSAVLFMITSLSLSYITPSGGGKSILEKTMPGSAPSSAPAVTDEMPIAPPGSTEDNPQTPAPDGTNK